MEEGPEEGKLEGPEEGPDEGKLEVSEEASENTSTLAYPSPPVTIVVTLYVSPYSSERCLLVGFESARLLHYHDKIPIFDGSFVESKCLWLSIRCKNHVTQLSTLVSTTYLSSVSES